MITFYQTMFCLSMALTFVYILMWHKHFDVHITLLYVLFPIANLGYLQMAQAKTIEEAIFTNKIVYIGGIFLLLFIMLSIFNLCHIELRREIRASLILIAILVYLSILTVGHSGIYYKSVTMEIINGETILHKEYGPMHTVFVLMTCVFFGMIVGAMTYSYIKKKDVSNITLDILILPVILAIISYFSGIVAAIPFAYVVAQAVYLVIIRRVNLYDITDIGIDSMVQSNGTGLISFDFKHRYIGSNETAKGIFPILKELTVDKSINGVEELQDTAFKWLTDYEQDKKNDKTLYSRGGKIFLITISDLYNGRRKKGYQFYITDDTKNQQYIDLLNRFNFSLRTEVEQKTAHIVEMHNKLLVSMATMVESRDNSTGGHIRRTSECVRILTDVIREAGKLKLSASFCANLIKAAPMHDLGKIAVDDAILRKPGRFLPEEYEKMKAHAAEGARIVHEILEGTDEPDFQRIAENVAHYHHERWDGSGYPAHLKGEEIPMEARIMAIADVYDALVSKRVYKDSMSFEQADRIMLEGMGTQFDKQLEPYYIAARPRLEAYYTSLSQ